MTQEYQPFIIRVEEQTGDTFPVTAEFQGASKPGDIPAALPLLTEQEIQQATRWLERGFIDRDHARDFGSRLFQTLFQGAIRERFREAFERVAPEDGLRVVLILPPALIDLPWELMYDEDGIHGFLARSATAPLVRHFASSPLSHQLPEKGPLRILIITASPQDYPPVSSEQEAREISASLAGSKLSIRETLRLLGQHLLRPRSLPDFLRRLRSRSLVEIDVLLHATQQNSQRRIASQDYHIVHFIGHGYADESGGQLLFENEDGEADPMPADEFAEMIAEQTVSLAVLNACETASSASLFRSAAQATLQRGVPAVIGMQVPFLDRAAVEFAREFYGAWAAGEPIEGALSYARRLIKKTSPGAAADWSVPVLYMRPIKEGLTLNLRPGPRSVRLRWPWPVRSLRSVVALLISLVSFIGLLLTIPDIVHTARTEIPFLRCAYPYSMNSGLSFNVAVAKFIVLDENGSSVKSKDGKALADFLFQQLEFNFDELDLDIPYEIRSPTYTCSIEGRTREEREEAAAALAERINAHIIIYGVITQAGDRSQFAPEFYINYKGFEGAEGGEEITGQHELGNALRIALPFDAAQFQGVENPALSARAEALSLISIGLSYYATDSHEKALDYFAQAEAIEGWLLTAGKEVIYVLLGNARGRLASQEKSTEYLAMALDYYDTALDITGDTYARAKVGRAGILYAMAIGDTTIPSWDTVDLDQLDEAEDTFKAALGLGNPPESANIETKVHFGLGQVYFIRAQVVEGDWMAQAGDEFEQVVEAYESGNTRVKNLAGHAYARLGIIARLQGTADAAVEHYTRATELVTPFYQAYYFSRLGETHAAVDQTGLAIEAYSEAISIAEFYGYGESVTKYSKRLNELRAGE